MEQQNTNTDANATLAPTVSTLLKKTTTFDLHCTKEDECRHTIFSPTIKDRCRSSPQNRTTRNTTTSSSSPTTNPLKQQQQQQQQQQDPLASSWVPYKFTDNTKNTAAVATTTTSFSFSSSNAKSSTPLVSFSPSPLPSVTTTATAATTAAVNSIQDDSFLEPKTDTLKQESNKQQRHHADVDSGKTLEEHPNQHPYMSLYPTMMDDPFRSDNAATTAVKNTRTSTDDTLRRVTLDYVGETYIKNTHNNMGPSASSLSPSSSSDEPPLHSDYEEKDEYYKGWVYDQSSNTIATGAIDLASSLNSVSKTEAVITNSMSSTTTKKNDNGKEVYIASSSLSKKLKTEHNDDGTLESGSKAAEVVQGGVRRDLLSSSFTSSNRSNSTTAVVEPEMTTAVHTTTTTTTTTTHPQMNPVQLRLYLASSSPKTALKKKKNERKRKQESQRSIVGTSTKDKTTTTTNKPKAARRLLFTSPSNSKSCGSNRSTTFTITTADIARRSNASNSVLSQCRISSNNDKENTINNNTLSVVDIHADSTLSKQQMQHNSTKRKSDIHRSTANNNNNFGSSSSSLLFSSSPLGESLPKKSKSIDTKNAAAALKEGKEEVSAPTIIPRRGNGLSTNNNRIRPDLMRAILGSRPLSSPSPSTTASSIQVIVSSDEFQNDLISTNELGLSNANGAFFYHKPAGNVAGTSTIQHDGQVMVRLNQKRFIIIDYSIVPNSHDVEFSKTNPHVHVPFGAGVNLCTGLVPSTTTARRCGDTSPSSSQVPCRKIGVPVVLYDSEPNGNGLSSKYVTSGLCFTCKRNVNENYRKQNNAKNLNQKVKRQREKEAQHTCNSKHSPQSLHTGSTIIKTTSDGSIIQSNKKHKTTPRPPSKLSEEGLNTCGSQLQQRSSSRRRYKTDRLVDRGHVDSCKKQVASSQSKRSPLRARVLSSSLSSSTKKIPKRSSSTISKKPSGRNTNQTSHNTIDLLDSSSDEDDYNHDNNDNGRSSKSRQQDIIDLVDSDSDPIDDRYKPKEKKNDTKTNGITTSNARYKKEKGTKKKNVNKDNHGHVFEVLIHSQMLKLSIAKFGKSFIIAAVTNTMFKELIFPWDEILQIGNTRLTNDMSLDHVVNIVKSTIERPLKIRLQRDGAYSGSIQKLDTSSNNVLEFKVNINTEQLGFSTLPVDKSCIVWKVTNEEHKNIIYPGDKIVQIGSDKLNDSVSSMKGNAIIASHTERPLAFLFQRDKIRFEWARKLNKEQIPSIHTNKHNDNSEIILINDSDSDDDDDIELSKNLKGKGISHNTSCDQWSDKNKYKTLSDASSIGSEFSIDSDSDSDDDQDEDYVDPSNKKTKNKVIRENQTIHKKNRLTYDGNKDSDTVNSSNTACSSDSGDDNGAPKITSSALKMADALFKRVYGQQGDLHCVCTESSPTDESYHYRSSSKADNKAGCSISLSMQQKPAADDRLMVVTSISLTLDDLRGRCNLGGFCLPNEILHFRETLQELSLTHCLKVPENFAREMTALRTIRLYANTNRSKNKKASQRGGNDNNNAKIPKHIVNFYVDAGDDRKKNQNHSPPPKLILYGFQTIPRELKQCRYVSLIGGSTCASYRY